MVKSAPPGWVALGQRLQKTFTFAGFPDAIAFMAAVSFFCHEKDHHPEWTNVYNKVTVELTTHDKGCVTDKDIALADHMNEKFDQFVR